ncbi:hypothetical protein DERP_000011 [Dermatophagoides pteronyssinus]|uniref:Uncharacterized protein n=1 Tax=Dermatophagoides pteronyssinus TaxID=6956 RepID=A0ABQ8IZB7_DERPT|nr:hypothetical protein DERP_000011 [Dermatophagoides pteronyssinus]
MYQITNESLGSSRCIIAPIQHRSGNVVGISLRECTIISIVPFNNSSSSSRVNNAFSPILANGRSRILSPVVSIFFTTNSHFG